MKTREQEKSPESCESVSNGIESAFTTMVQRWLVKGSNGQWQLPVNTKKKEVGSKKPVQGSESRKRLLDQPKQPGKKAKVHWSQEIDVKTSESVKCKAVVKTTEINPDIGAVTLPSAAARKDERPLLRSRKNPTHKIKEQRAAERPKRFLIQNIATPPRCGKGAAPLSTSQSDIETKNTSGEVDGSGVTGTGSLFNVKQEPRNSSFEDTKVARDCTLDVCGRREKYKPERCKNYTYQVLCKAHPSGTQGKITETKSGSPKADGTMNVAKPSGGRTTKSKSRRVGNPPSKSTAKNRTILQTEKLSKSLASDAWQASELPSLFRNAGKHTMKNLKNKGTERTTGENCSTVPPPTKMRKLVSSKDEGICKVRACKLVAISEGFCKTHVKCKRCRKEGCNNIAAVRVRGFCWYHAPVKECGEVGCTTKARQWGRCAKHGGKHYCREEGCSKGVYQQRLCHAHFDQQEHPDLRLRSRIRNGS